MKTILFLAVAAAGFAAVAVPVKAGEPDTLKVMPQIQELLSQLGKTSEGSSSQNGTSPSLTEKAMAPQMQALMGELMTLIAWLQKEQSGQGQSATDVKLPPEIQKLADLLQKQGSEKSATAPNTGGDPQIDNLLGPAMRALVAQLQQATANGNAGGDQSSAVVKLMPQIQALLSHLLDTADPNPSPANPAPTAASAPEGATPSGTEASRSAARTGNQPKLQASKLNTSGLKMGTLDGAPRMNNAEWRDLFPAKQ